MSLEVEKRFNINRVALLYRDLLSNSIHSLSDSDKKLLLSIKPNNKIVAIGDIDLQNWAAYPLTYMLSKKLVGPIVLDESKIYQSWQAMRTHNESIVHPQSLIGECVVIRIIGLDTSTNINEYINSFISQCIASDFCKLIFIIVDSDKKTYKNNIYIRKSNSTFIDTSKGTPYQIEGSALCVKPDDITFFTKTKQVKSSSAGDAKADSSSPSRKKNSLSSMINDADIF